MVPVNSRNIFFHVGKPSFSGPSLTLSVGMSTQGNFLSLLVECDFDFGMTFITDSNEPITVPSMVTECALLAGCSPVAQGAFRMTCEVRNPGSGGGK